MSADAIWQTHPDVLAMWDQRRHFGGWGMVCQALIVLKMHDLQGETSPGATERAVGFLDGLLARHGTVPTVFKLAYFRDRLALYSTPAEGIEAEMYTEKCRAIAALLPKDTPHV